MSVVDGIIFALIAFGGGVVSSTFGIGGAFIIIPLSALIIPLKKSIAILAFFFIAGDIAKSIVFWKDIDWRATNLLWIGAIPGVLFGSLSLVKFPVDIVQKILGLMILLYVVNSYTGFIEKIKVGSSMIVVGGFLYGFFSGIIGTGAAIKGAILLQLGLRKEKFIGTMSVNAVILNLVKILVYSKYTLIGRDDLWVIALLMITSVLAVLTGRFFVKRVSATVFRNVVLGILLLSSIKMLV